MPKKTLYVREEDQAIWDKAETLSDSESLSSIVTAALRRYILSKDRGGKFGRTELSVAIISDNAVVGERQIAFQGCFLTGDGKYDVYETAKGQLLIYHTDSGYGFYKVYPTVEAAAKETDERTDERIYSEELLAVIAEEMNDEWVEELDI